MNYWHEILDNVGFGVILMNIDKKCIYSNAFVKKMLDTNETNGICQIYINKIHQELEWTDKLKFEAWSN